MAVVKVENVKKSYSKTVILDHITLEVESSQILGLIGPSGAGKTTLVKVILGMEKVDEGNVEIFNTKIPNLKLLDSIGYMAQSDALYEELTGRENLEFFGKIYGLKKDKLRERIEYTSALVDLKEHLNKRVSKYSGGMKRRLSLALALLQDPKVLVLDEPTVGIDPKLRYSIWQELKKLKESGKTIIVTTHVMDEAEKCDKLALINNGKVLAMGSSEKLKEEFKAASIEEIFLMYN
ncbi:ABC-2 type transport system ATP-binding protein [Clostridium collagenovorans DSM 3089]|uniref:ABC-2 type transport system ATP-binding protein n=1 Tax=Clostridium collagenovorans DSM 3089 TaxID=1121306 RepID=A0A1M5S3K2_9CLOT|nr:ABC transporter ATP-binding protein [Clostridium collagenovorans]SHH32868.1 ABC-2 type transport system ATP-binding protein [Clostridium collagenovorans DSM 3089]